MAAHLLGLDSVSEYAGILHGDHVRMADHRTTLHRVGKLIRARSVVTNDGAAERQPADYVIPPTRGMIIRVA